MKLPLSLYFKYSKNVCVKYIYLNIRPNRLQSRDISLHRLRQPETRQLPQVSVKFHFWFSTLTYDVIVRRSIHVWTTWYCLKVWQHHLRKLARKYQWIITNIILQTSYTVYHQHIAIYIARFHYHHHHHHAPYRSAWVVMFRYLTLSTASDQTCDLVPVLPCGQTISTFINLSFHLVLVPLSLRNVTNCQA